MTPRSAGRFASTLSDVTLRSGAWALWWFLTAMIVVNVPLSLVDEPATAQTWGGGGGLVEDIAFAVVVVSFPLTGLLILRRQPRNTIGWILQGIGFVWGLGALADSYASYGLLHNPGSLPGPDVAAALSEGIWAPAVGLMGTFLILLYPDGHLPSPRWRPVAWLSAVTMLVVFLAVDLGPGQLEESAVPTMANPLGVESAERVLFVVLTIFVPLLAVCIVACAVALVRRFRHSHGIERLQLKWLTTGGAVVAFLYLVSILVSLVPAVSSGDQERDWIVVLQGVSELSFILLPLAIGLAVLRYRLYDVDVVINRALVYGALTATLGLVYLLSVLLLQIVLSPLTDQSDLAVAAATLGVAALFRPARARIQGVVDRRFYRARYDAARTVEAFTGRLRQDVDLESVSTDLRGVVGETVQPVHVSLWLRSSP